MGSIISIVNNKGGVGKTTTAINLAHALSLKGKKVLLVDMDTQCNTTGFFDVQPEKSLYELLTDITTTPIRCIYPTQIAGVHILPNVENTAFIESDLYSDPTHVRFLLDRLRPHIIDRYDVTLIDCPPSMGCFVWMAMVASDFVVIPIEAGSRMSLEGITKTIRAINEIRTSTLNEHLLLLKFLYTKANLRRSADMSALTVLKERFPGQIFETTIHEATAIKQAEMVRETVLKNAPKSKSSVKFKELADEVLNEIEGLKN